MGVYAYLITAQGDHKMLTNEEREGRLIRLTDEMANLALYPLTRERAETMRDFAGKVAELAEAAA